MQLVSNITMDGKTHLNYAIGYNVPGLEVWCMDCHTSELQPRSEMIHHANTDVIKKKHQQGTNHRRKQATMVGSIPTPSKDIITRAGNIAHATELPDRG